MIAGLRQAAVVGILTTRIGRRFVALFAGCALLPLALFAWIVLVRVGNQMSSDLRASLQNGAKTAGMGIAARLSQVAGDLILAEELVQKRRNDDRTGEPALQQHVQERCDALWLVSGGQVQRLSGDAEDTVPMPPLSADELQHLATGKPLVRCVGQAARLFMLRALDAANPESGWLVAGIRQRWFWDPAELRTTGCEFMAIAAAGGQVLFDTFQQAPALHSLMVAVDRNKASGSVDWDANGEAHVARWWRAFLLPQYGLDMVVVQSRSEREAFQVENSFVRWFVMTAVGAGLFVLGISLVHIRRTLDPILSLRAATDSVGRGDLAARVTIRGDDEFAALGASFNDMATQLAQNVRQREQTERELMASRDAALAAVRAKAEFVTNVSHEFRTPMTEILSAVEIITQLGADEAAAREEFSNIALRGGQRLARLVDDVLELGATSAWTKDVVDLRGTIDEAIRTLPEAVRGRVEVEIQAGLPELIGSASRLSEAWARLLDNAVKFSEADTPIRVRARSLAAGLQVEIRDAGVGIDAADHARIFEPFCQVGRDQLIDKANGTGLGLTLAKNTIERHGGRIEVDSAPGRGTTMRIWLPVGAEVAAALG